MNLKLLRRPLLPLPSLRTIGAWAFCLVLPTTALAHKGSDAYLDVQTKVVAAAASASNLPQAQNVRGYEFTLSIAIKDLDLALPLDANADGQVTWGEIKAVLPQVQQLANQSALLHVNADQSTACRLDWHYAALEQRSDGAYVKLASTSHCDATQPLALRYSLFKNQDANHRLLVTGRIHGKDLLTYTSAQQTAPLLLAAAQVQTSAQALDPAQVQGRFEGQIEGSATRSAKASEPGDGARWQVLLDYARLGMHHLLEGYDHLAFLLALVLPLQLKLGSALAAKPSGGRGWLVLFRTVTAFTLGHSITLVMATLGWTQASPVWVEPVIALSIGVTAWLNLHPVKWLRTDVLALLFGLIHGFGFAGLLQEAAAPEGLLPFALLGFNLGVEAGQLMAVSAWVLLSQLVVARPWYHSGVVRRGSHMLMLLAAFWFCQRVV
jgi:HupE / UreJ protein